MLLLLLFTLVYPCLKSISSDCFEGGRPRQGQDWEGAEAQVHQERNCLENNFSFWISFETDNSCIDPPHPPHMCSRSSWQRRRQVGRRSHSLTPHSYKRPNPLEIWSWPLFTNWMHYWLICKELLFTNDDVQEMPKVSVVARPHELAAIQNLPLSAPLLPSHCCHHHNCKFTNHQKPIAGIA